MGSLDQRRVASEAFAIVVGRGPAIDQRIIAAEDFLPATGHHGHGDFARADMTPDTPRSDATDACTSSSSCRSPSIAIVEAGRSQLQAERDAWNGDKHSLKRQVRRLKAQVVSLQEDKSQLEAAQNQNPLIAIDQSYRFQRNLMVALIRNRGSSSSVCAAGVSQLVIDKAIGRVSVCRWERTLGTSLLAASADFHIQHEEEFKTAALLDVWTCAACCVTADATKSAAFKQDKLQSMRLRTWYKYIGADTAFNEVWPDVQIVGQDASAENALRLMHRQLRLVQNPYFDFCNGECRCCSLGIRQVRFLTCGGDQGPDQVGVRNSLVDRYATCIRIIVTACVCLMHQQSLANCRIMKGTDDVSKFWSCQFLYYASLNKNVNLWRSKPVAVWRCVAGVYGFNHPFAIHAKKKVPECISNRWGSVSAAEKHYKLLPVKDVRHVNRTCFTRSNNATRTAQKSNTPLDDAKIDAMKQYSETQGRWSTEVNRATDSHEYFDMLELSHAVKKPLERLLNHLQKPQHRLKDGETTLSTLICETLGKISEDYVDLWNSSVWEENEPDLVAIFPDQYFAGVATLIARSYCEYEHRILDRLTRFPFPLMFLVQKPPEVDDAQRKQVSNKLLDYPFEHLDLCSAKIRALLQPELEEAARTGRLDNDVWHVLNTWRQSCPADVQHVESGNSVLTKETANALAMDHALTASRFTIKQELASAGDSAGAPSKEAFDKVLEKSIKSFDSEPYRKIVLHAVRWQGDTADALGLSDLLPLPSGDALPPDAAPTPLSDGRTERASPAPAPDGSEPADPSGPAPAGAPAAAAEAAAEVPQWQSASKGWTS